MTSKSTGATRGVQSLAVGLCALLAATLSLSEADAATLRVTISKVQPGPGNIRVALYADAGSFRHEDRALRVLSTPATTASVAVVFTDLPAGRYAVLAYHDANDNRKLDMRMGMFPAEGWGLSNDPTVIGPPRFSASAFDVAEPATNLKVHLTY